MSKWDRRDKKKLNKHKMRVSGAGNRLLARVIMNKAVWGVNGRQQDSES